MTKNSLDFPLAMQTRLKPINAELYCFAISLIVKATVCMCEHQHEHLLCESMSFADLCEQGNKQPSAYQGP